MRRNLSIKLFLQCGLFMFLIKSVLAQINKDSILHINLNKVNEFGFEKKFDSANYYIKKANFISEKSQNKELIGYVNIYKAKISYWEAQTEEAKRVLDNNLVKELQLSDSIMVKTYLLYGEIFLYEKNYPKALTQHIEAEKILINKINFTKKDSNKICKSYDRIGHIHKELKNRNKAKQYLEKALKFASSTNMKSFFLFKISNLYKEEENEQRELTYLLEAERIASENKWQLMLPTYYSGLSDYYIRKKNGDSAIYYAKKGLVNNTYCRLNWLNANIGKAYCIKKEIAKAVPYFKEALVYTTPEETLEIYENLRDSYEELGKYKLAIVQNKLFLKLKDSLNNLKVKQEIVDITEKYESDKKELKIEILNRKDENNKLVIKKQKIKVLLFGLLLVSALAILIIIFFYYKKEEKQKHLLYIKNRELAQELKERVKPIKRKELVLEELKKDEIEKLVLDLIQANFYLEKDITLTKIAKRLHTNTSYLSKFVNENYKKSFSNFINDLRISFILKELEGAPDYRRYTIEHIADLAGFTSSNAFYRAFKKFTGLTPSYYIKKIMEQD